MAIASAQQSSSDENFDGIVEVLHADDFEHPENSKYIFYLVTENQRYELISDKQLPVVISGTLVNVKGRLYEGKIIIEEFNIKPPTADLSEQEQTLAAGEQEEKEAASRFNMVWLHAGAPIMLVLALLAYVELKRKKDHNQLLQQKMQHNMLALRNYVTTNLRKGYNKEQIRNALIKNNYSNEEIEEAFKGIK